MSLFRHIDTCRRERKFNSLFPVSLNYFSYNRTFYLNIICPRGSGSFANQSYNNWARCHVFNKSMNSILNVVISVCNFSKYFTGSVKLFVRSSVLNIYWNIYSSSMSLRNICDFFVRKLVVRNINNKTFQCSDCCRTQVNIFNSTFVAVKLYVFTNFVNSVRKKSYRPEYVSYCFFSSKTDC